MAVSRENHVSIAPFIFKVSTSPQDFFQLLIKEKLLEVLKDIFIIKRMRKSQGILFYPTSKYYF